MNILSLTDIPGAIEQVAEWHQSQRWAFGSETTLDERRDRLHYHLEAEPVPRTFVALCDNELVGSASLVVYRPTRATVPSHWLANLYVRESHRRRGIGTWLVNHVRQYAARLGLSRLHLFTTDQKAFYLRRNWVWVRQSHLRGQSVDIMSISCSPPAHSTPVTFPESR